MRNVLERLGPPEEIVAAAGPVQRRSGRLELAAMIALAIPFLGWFVGVVLVTASRAWTRREKAVAIGLVLLPCSRARSGLCRRLRRQLGGHPGWSDGLARSSGNGSSSLGPLELAVILGTFFAGPLSAVYLGSRLRRPEEPAGLASA